MDDFIFFLIAIIITMCVGLMAGGSMAQPDELENGCLVYENKIYCERVE